MKKSTKLLSLILSASLASQMISSVNINANKDSITFYDVKNNILDLKAYDAELDTNHDGNMNVFDVIRANKTLIQEESYTDLKEKVYMLETQIESLYQKLNEKTDTEEGKQLSSNDYTDEEKQKLEGLNNYDDTKIKTEVSELSGTLSGKVDKEEGKQLSSNDYTDEEKQKLECLNNYDDTKLNAKIDSLVQTAYEEKKEIESSIDNKVNKEEGKQLSSNDYTDEEKQKLESLTNYDDTELINEISHIKNDLTKDLNYGGVYTGDLSQSTENKWYYCYKSDSAGYPIGITNEYILINYPVYKSNGDISFSSQIILPYSDGENNKIYFRSSNLFEWIELNGDSNKFSFRSFVTGDINEVLNSGWYIGNSTEVTNIPDINGYFNLFVYENKNSDGGVVNSYQMLYPHAETNFVYYRNNNTSEWKSINTSKLSGKRITVIGDSITEKNNTATVNWTDWLGYSGAIVQNLGVSGTGFWNGLSENINYINRISQIDEPDIIGVSVSFNDIGHDEIEIGNAFDITSDGTVLGYAHDFFNELVKEYPSTPICVYSTNEWADMHDDEWYQIRAKQYIEGIKIICENNAIPFKSIWKSCNLRPWDYDNRSKYFYDVTHPNDLGHQLIFNNLLSLFEECAVID